MDDFSTIRDGYWTVTTHFRKPNKPKKIKMTLAPINHKRNKMNQIRRYDNLKAMCVDGDLIRVDDLIEYLNKEIELAREKVKTLWYDEAGRSENYIKNGLDMMKFNGEFDAFVRVLRATGVEHDGKLHVIKEKNV